MGHISLRACAKIVQNNRKRSLTHPLSMLSTWWFFQLKILIEFWYTKKAICTLISRFKIILLRSFASKPEPHMTWRKFVEAFLHFWNSWNSSAVPTERRHAAHQTTTLNKEVWESMLEIWNRFSKMRWLRFINHQLSLHRLHPPYTFFQDPIHKACASAQGQAPCTWGKTYKSGFSWWLMLLVFLLPRAWTVFFVFLGGVSSKAALLSTSFPHLFGHFPKPFSYAACFKSLSNSKIWELSVQRHAKGSAAGSWHKRLAGLSMKFQKQCMVQSRPMCLVETQ